MANRLRHDTAFASTHILLEVFVLREEEKAEAFPLVYERLLAMLAAYDLQIEREERRLRPGK